MEARVLRVALIAASLFIFPAATYRTANFVVTTPDARLAEQFGKAAEKFRHDLAIEWIGQALPNWSQPCPMTVQVGPSLPAGGSTSFVFHNGEVYGWRMSLQGSAERVLDSVIPHEVTHMIFASYFRRPLPRWADEGGASSVEHPSELAKHRRMLVKFLQTGHGIAFPQMFAMTEYPPDILALYGQAYSLCDYLIEQKGRRHYVKFMADGMRSNDWAGAVQRNYGFKDLGTLQNAWVAWVGQGSPRLERQPSSGAAEIVVAAAPRPPRPEPNLILHVPARVGLPPMPDAAEDSAPSQPPPQDASPQPTARARQVILEWNRPGQG